jgi:RNA polymerase sigma-70 factor (ECF subfamily)
MDKHAKIELLTKFIVDHRNGSISFLGKFFECDEDIEDVIQNAALKALNYIDYYNEKTGCKFSTWMYTILKNESISLIRKRNASGKRIPARLIDRIGEYDIYGYTENEPILDDEMASNWRKLNGKQKRLLNMRIVGYSYKEIADFENIPLGTVKSIINRARAKMNGM